MTESQGSDTQINTQTELLAKKGIEYANNMMAMTRERVKLLFDAEIQVMLAESPFPTSTFTIHEEDYEAKMRYLCRRILDNDMKAARREDPEDLFVKKEKRSHETEDIKPLQSQKSARGENGEHVQKTVIDLEQGDGDEGWDEPFQGFPDRLNEPRKQQGGRSGRLNNSQQSQRTHDRTRQSPGKQMAEILSKKMAVQAASFKPLGYSDRAFIFRDLGKFRYVGSDWKVVTPKGRTRLEQGDQYADAMTGLIDAQQALLVAMESGIGGHSNIEQIAHAYAMLCVGANAVAQLRELANAPRELRGVVGGSILPADIFSDDSIESIKRYLELKRVDQMYFPYQQGLFSYPQSQIQQPQWLQHLYQPFQQFQPFQPFGMQQTPYAASQFGYGRGAAAGRGFQSRGRGGRGRGAFGSNFIPLGGQ
ncbi:MAG: hypothetical protein EZS28_043901 [Streblomastix strix]|uniref:Uncharacterized protein n=1 Tax=Streblomastix strix TaxID=222440 RepID=A0A5J4TRP4_9EUKA|nr:MAG: hypothetical protein EZS28_043901 [Streblomastix strix]